MDDTELNRRELTGNDALRFAREVGMEEASRGGLFYAGVGDLIRFARLVRAGWKPPASGGRVVGHACKLDGSICESRPDRCSDCPAGAGGKS